MLAVDFWSKAGRIWSSLISTDRYDSFIRMMATGIFCVIIVGPFTIPFVMLLYSFTHPTETKMQNPISRFEEATDLNVPDGVTVIDSGVTGENGITEYTEFFIIMDVSNTTTIDDWLQQTPGWADTVWESMWQTSTWPYGPVPKNSIKHSYFGTSRTDPRLEWISDDESIRYAIGNRIQNKEPHVDYRDSGRILILRPLMEEVWYSEWSSNW